MTVHSKSVSSQVNYEAQFFNSIDEIDAEKWNNTLSNRNIYLSIPYLKALQTGLKTYDFKYIIFYNQDKEPVGICYCQIIKITAAEINIAALVQRIGGMLPQNIIKRMDLRVLICGNAFASGENGFLFKEGIETQNAIDLVSNAIDEIHYSEKKQGKKISITMIKEFWPASFEAISYLKDKGCTEINIDVNMVLTLKEEWTQFDDYLDAMNSKFRTKAKQVFQKSSRIEIRKFTEETILIHLDEIDTLYNTIVDRANFSFGRLNATTLLLVKKALGDDFYFNGYFIDNKLIGFSTATHFDNVLDGNFIGLDYNFNQEFAMYQRMLYDFVAHALHVKAIYVRIGRTAEEIKSGIGALPVEMKFYAKHRNRIKNALLKPFVNKLEPTNFELRKPFKSEYYR